MVKAKAKVGNREMIILGLSFGNLERFRQEPCDTYIKILGDEIGVPFDIMIVSGETEKDIVNMLSGGFDEDTKIILT